MRKLIATLIVTMLCVCSITIGQDVNEPVKGFTSWIGVTENTNSTLIGRIGWQEKQIELGGTCKWWTANEEQRITPDVAGAYLLFFLKQEGKIIDPQPDNPIDIWLQKLNSNPYAGAEIVGRTKSGVDHSARINWMAGSLFSFNPDYKTSLAIEYIGGQGAIMPDDDWGVVFHFRHRF